MKIIRQNTPDFLIELGNQNTGDYALEDFLIIFDETCKTITMPAQSMIKGNPNFYFVCVSTSAFKFMLKFSTPDYLPCNVFVDPSGKLFNFEVDINLNVLNKQLFYLKPLAGGMWFGS